MNEEKILEMISLVDDEFILEASYKKRTIRLGKHAVSLAAAAVLCCVLLACAAAAVVVTGIVHKGDLNEFYTSSAVDEMQSRGYTFGKTAQTEHARMTLESVIADDFRCICVYTIEALDDAADEQLRRSFGGINHDLIIDTQLLYADTGEVIFDCIGTGGFSHYGQKAERSVTLSSTFYYTLDGWKDGKPFTFSIDKSRPMKLKLDQKTADNNEKLHILDGLEINIPQVEPLKSIKMYSETGKTAYITEMGITVNGLQKSDVSKDPTPTLIYKNGTQITGWEIGRNNAGSWHRIDGQNVAFIDFRRFIDLQNIDSAILFGEKYHRT